MCIDLKNAIDITKLATILRKPRRSLSRYIKESDPSAREPGTWQMQALPYLSDDRAILHGDDAMLTSPPRAKGNDMTRAQMMKASRYSPKSSYYWAEWLNMYFGDHLSQTWFK